jgi:hypothetical protein
MLLLCGYSGTIVTRRPVFLIPQSWIHPSYRHHPSNSSLWGTAPVSCPLLLRPHPNTALCDCTCLQSHAFLQVTTSLFVLASPWGHPCHAVFPQPWLNVLLSSFKGKGLSMAELSHWAMCSVCLGSQPPSILYCCGLEATDFAEFWAWFNHLAAV